jgi:hypothetical protein
VVTFRGNSSLLSHTLANAVTRIKPGLVDFHKLDFLGDPFELEAPHALAPAPLSDGRIVCSYTPEASLEVDKQGRTTASYDFGLYVANKSLKRLTLVYNDPDTDELDAVIVRSRNLPVIPDCPDADTITDDPEIDLDLTATMINHNVYADLLPDVVDIPSPRAGTVAAVDIYDDSQTFVTSEEFPLLRKQMASFYGSFPVDENGAFTATVPADKPFLFVLVNKDGVAVRSPLAVRGKHRLFNSITHTFNGHDYLRPNDVIHCTGCHKGHMMNPELAEEAKTNLSRLAKAEASSEWNPHFSGSWRINDFLASDKEGRYSWITDEGPGAWVRLTWPKKVRAEQAVLYAPTLEGCNIFGATLTLSSGKQIRTGSLPDDGSPLLVSFGSSRDISWIRFAVDSSSSYLVGLAEMVVNGPPDVDIPDTKPYPPAFLNTVEGLSLLHWDPALKQGTAGYRIYFGNSSGSYSDGVDVGNVSWFLMRDLVEDGLTYFIAAKAYNIYGTESRSFSNEVSFTVHAPVVKSIKPDSGPPGGFTQITIKGRHFAPKGLRVMLGGKHALEVKVVNDKTITALTHWHQPGVVDVVVSNPDDLYGILPQAFTYEKK